MSKLFFEDLEIPRPDIDLNVGSASHAFQTAEIMKTFEPLLLKFKPDYILVVGDVNSTIACALTASKLGIKIIHVEAGLRSFDRSMPEEINRVLTDALSDVLFTTEKSAEENLLREGIAKDKIFLVGNVMVDTLLKHKRKAQKSEILFRLGLIDSKLPGLAPRSGAGKTRNSELAPYAVLTLHRPGNVDNKTNLINILEALKEISKRLPIIFPIHPRTKKQIENMNLSGYFQSLPRFKGIHCIDPLGYLDFLCLMSNARLVLTDSGGIQEETTVLSIPCLTIRENTERPVTVTEGTNCVVGTDKQRIIEESSNALNGKKPLRRIPELWDGKAAKRIINMLTSKI
jgi:UDP-N-acetylglucosamine 2-epimerase (non-hydrolysing)